MGKRREYPRSPRPIESAKDYGPCMEAAMALAAHLRVCQDDKKCPIESIINSAANWDIAGVSEYIEHLEGDAK